MAFQTHGYGNSRATRLPDSHHLLVVCPIVIYPVIIYPLIIYPVIMVARISIGWNISHIDAAQRIRLTVAHGMNTGIGL